MDIREIRRHFQKPVNFTVLTTYAKPFLLLRAQYSLSQTTLRDEVTMHVYSKDDLELIGHAIQIGAQTYIVYRQLSEPFSNNHYLYTLMPAISSVSLATVTTAKNAIGSTAPTLGEYVAYPCFLNSYATTEITRPTQQVTQMYQQEFMLASKAIDLSKTYKLSYMGQPYKIKSKLLDNGILKIFAVEDV